MAGYYPINIAHPSVPGFALEAGDFPYKLNPKAVKFYLSNALGHGWYPDATLVEWADRISAAFSQDHAVEHRWLEFLRMMENLYKDCKGLVTTTNPPRQNPAKLQSTGAWGSKIKLYFYIPLLAGSRIPNCFAIRVGCSKMSGRKGLFQLDMTAGQMGTWTGHLNNAPPSDFTVTNLTGALERGEINGNTPDLPDLDSTTGHNGNTRTVSSIENPRLPPNAMSAFGGVDASQAVFDPASIRTNLFDFQTLDETAYEVECTVPEAMSSTSQVKFAIPGHMTFSWGSKTESLTISGETKTDFVSKLTRTVGAGFDVAGFGGEFSRTWSDESQAETYNKYIAIYNQAVVYRLGFADIAAIKEHLTRFAKNALSTWDAIRIVETFGTHYMTDASFGGLSITSSTLNVRDTVRTTDLNQAIELKVAYEKSSAHAEDKTIDHTVEKIMQKMDRTHTVTIGGISASDIDVWRNSLFTNPNVVDYKLRPISDLVASDLKSSVDARIKEVLNVTLPADKFDLLAMYVPIKKYNSDGNSSARADFSCAYPDAPEGWLRLCQYGQGQKWDNSFRGVELCKGIAICVNPNKPIDLGAEPLVKAAESAQEQWIHDDGFRVWRLEGGANYASFGELFSQQPGRQELQYDRYAVVHRSILLDIPGKSGTWIWDDKGSGARQDVTLLGFETRGKAINAQGEPAGGDKEFDVFIPGPDSANAYPFVSRPWYGSETSLPGIKLDWSKVKWLDSNFL